MEQSSLIRPPIEGYLVEHFSADGLCPDKARCNLEKHFSEVLEITEKFNRQSVSYQLSKRDVLHSWLKYKEGFSADLVNNLLDEMKISEGDIVMDPFMGSGTTALVCQMRGYNSIGYDIMPISSVSITAKANALKYDLSEIKKMINALRTLEMPNTYSRITPFVTITKGAYPQYTERFLAFNAEWRDNSSYSDAVKNLLTLCIINSLERISYTSKSGQYLSWDCRSAKVQEVNVIRQSKGQKPLTAKYVRETILEAKDTILAELEHVASDIELIQQNSVATAARIDFIPNSVLYEIPKFQDNILKGVITSPPYCNRYDYTRTYALELVYLGVDEEGLKKMRQDLLSCTVESRPKIDDLRAFYSSIGQTERFNYIYEKIKSNEAFSEVMGALHTRKEHGDLNNNGVIKMIEGYFTELAFVYAELYRICKKGAMVAFVNDNVRYGGEVIPVDFISSSFAEQFGFRVKKVYALKQKKGNSSQQMAKFGRIALRKSITIWEKE